MIRLFISVLFLVLVNFSFSQVNWIRLENLSDSLILKPKPVFVFIHAPWCGYCRMMEHNVFSDQELSNQLNRDYYCISLDAEMPDTLSYGGIDYPPELQPNGKVINSLAKRIGAVDGKLNYPTCVFLDAKLIVQAQYASYLKKSDLQYVLKTLTK